MEQIENFSPFEKGLIVNVRLAGALISKNVDLSRFSKAAIWKVFKNWIETHSSSVEEFLRFEHIVPRAWSTSSPTNCTAKQWLSCNSIYANRQSGLFPTDISSNNAQKIAENRIAWSTAWEKTTHFCPERKNSLVVVSGKKHTEILRNETGNLVKWITLHLILR